MSKSELVSSASKDGNNGTEESETSEISPCISKESVKGNCPGKE